MNVSNVIVSYNSVKMHVSGTLDCNKELISPKYKIHFIEYQLKGLLIANNLWYLLIRFKKCVDDGLLYTLRVNSAELSIESKTFISDDSEWRVLGRYYKFIKFNIEVNVGIKTSSYFGVLVHDDSLTDFEIKGIDGSIRVHKIVLAAASEVFRQMLTNNFKEKKEAQVELPYSICVLQDLKEYLYLNTLNNDNLENILLLAHCYMMYELKQDCINRLIFNITTEKSLELIEFSVANRITDLLVALLKIIQKNEVDFENYEIVLPICNGYVTCKYDRRWWLASVLSKDNESEDVVLAFLHPSGPSPSFVFPRKPDVLKVNSKQILTKVNPNTATGRTYVISQNENIAATKSLTSRLRFT